jgi:hypothetical protein
MQTYLEQLKGIFAAKANKRHHIPLDKIHPTVGMNCKIKRETLSSQGEARQTQTQTQTQTTQTQAQTRSRHLFLP